MQRIVNPCRKAIQVRILTVVLMKTVTEYSLVRLQTLGGVQVEKHRLPDGMSWMDTVWDWEPDWIASIVDLKNYRYLWFEDIEQTRISDDGIITFTSPVLRHSGKYFINAFVETYQDVLINNRELAKQMTNLDWTHIVKGIDQHWTEHFDPERDRLICQNGKLSGC